MNKKLLFAIPVILPLLASCVGTKQYALEDYEVGVKWSNPEEDFRILQLCDIHLSQSDIYERHFKLLGKTIKQANPNLIVLNGDSFTYADKGVVAKLFAFIDSYDIAWTFTYGNHDDQGYFADTYIQRILTDKSLFKNAKFVNNEDDNVTGRSNFVLNIYQREKNAAGEYESNTVFQVYCLESHSYNFDTIAYDYIKQDQIDWYERMVKDSAEKYGEVLPSAMYFHIPLPEFFSAWEDSKKEGGGVHGAEVILGKTQEFGGGPTVESDTHLFDKVKELDSTIAISCAHDHINDSVIMYDDVALCFGVHATDRIYYDAEMLGGQVISINHDNPWELSFENIYETYEEGK